LIRSQFFTTSRDPETVTSPKTCGAGGQLLGDGVAHGSEVELPFLAGDAGLEDDLEEQIAELLAVVDGVPRLDRLDDLVCLLEKIGRERPQGLLAVPRAPSGIAELVHDVEEPPDGALRRLLVCHEVPGCTTQHPLGFRPDSLVVRCALL
jgi:hypothetical protein